MGHDIRVTAPPTHDHTWDADPAAPSAPVSPSEFWDNITIPLSAYIPAPRDGSPEHRTPPPVSAYTQHREAPNVWDRPVTTWEPALEPVQDKEPVASGSTLRSQTTAVIGQMPSSSTICHVDPDYTVDVGGASIGSSQQSHDLHRSYSHPLSRDTMSTSPMRPAERAPSRSSLDPPRHTRPTTPMEGQAQTRPPSQRSIHEPLPEMDLPESIRFYQRTATDLSVAIPVRLRRAEYRELYEYYAYELPFILAWDRPRLGMIIL